MSRELWGSNAPNDLCTVLGFTWLTEQPCSCVASGWQVGNLHEALLILTGRSHIAWQMYIQGMRWDVWNFWVSESSSRTTMSLLWRLALSVGRFWSCLFMSLRSTLEYTDSDEAHARLDKFDIADGLNWSLSPWVLQSWCFSLSADCDFANLSTTPCFFFRVSGFVVPPCFYFLCVVVSALLISNRPFNISMEPIPILLSHRISSATWTPCQDVLPACKPQPEAPTSKSMRVIPVVPVRDVWFFSWTWGFWWFCLFSPLLHAYSAHWSHLTEFDQLNLQSHANFQYLPLPSSTFLWWNPWLSSSLSYPIPTCCRPSKRSWTPSARGRSERWCSRNCLVLASSGISGEKMESFLTLCITTVTRTGYKINRSGSLTGRIGSSLTNNPHCHDALHLSPSVLLLVGGGLHEEYPGLQGPAAAVFFRAMRLENLWG